MTRTRVVLMLKIRFLGKLAWTSSNPVFREVIFQSQDRIPESLNMTRKPQLIHHEILHRQVVENAECLGFSINCTNKLRSEFTALHVTHMLK